MIGQCHRRHRALEFRKFLDAIVREAAEWSRWEDGADPELVPFTPTSASWLNLVERWFGLLTEKQLRRGVHQSSAELEAAIYRCGRHQRRHQALGMARSGPLLPAYFRYRTLEGRSLREMIRAGRFLPFEVARMGVDLIQAVCWLSHQGMVHRDIKPANIMWATERSRYVLLDPGIALDLYGPSLTLGPMPVGTMPYLSPEQMEPTRKRFLDFRSDLFAIGVVLYEAAAAEHPFMTTGTTVSQVLAGILTTTPQALADRVEGFPKSLSDLVARLVAKSPHLRYRTCERARAAVEEEAASLGVTV